MEEQEKTNYVHVEGQVDPTATSTVTTTENENSEYRDNTVEMKPKVTPKTGEKKLSEKESKFQRVFQYLDKVNEEITSLRQKTGIIAAYTQQLGKVTSDQVNDLSNAILTIYNDMYRNCKTLKEEHILDTEVEQYLPIIGSYFSNNQEVVRIIAIETGWVVKETKPGEGTIEVDTPKGKQQVPFSDVTFEYKGSELKSINYPTAFSTQATNGNEAIMKLRTYLFSLNKNTEDKSIIV